MLWKNKMNEQYESGNKLGWNRHKIQSLEVQLTSESPLLLAYWCTKATMRLINTPLLGVYCSQFSSIYWHKYSWDCLKKLMKTTYELWHVISYFQLIFLLDSLWKQFDFIFCYRNNLYINTYMISIYAKGHAKQCTWCTC
jgi:hypothetical protein